MDDAYPSSAPPADGAQEAAASLFQNTSPWVAKEGDARRAAIQTLRNLSESVRRLSRMVEGGERGAVLELMYEQACSLRSIINAAGWEVLTSFSSLLAKLSGTLLRDPEKVNASTLRTITHAIDLLVHLAGSSTRCRVIEVTPLRMLVLDDDPVCRRALLMALSSGDLKLSAFGGAEEALDCLARETFDVIFTDVMMPKMDGFAFATAVRGIPNHHATPIVFVTVLSDFETRSKSVLSGGDDLLAKPFIAAEVAVKAFTLALRRRIAVPDIQQPSPTPAAGQSQHERQDAQVASSSPGTPEADASAMAAPPDRAPSPTPGGKSNPVPIVLASAVEGGNGDGRELGRGDHDDRTELANQQEIREKLERTSRGEEAIAPLQTELQTVIAANNELVLAQSALCSRLHESEAREAALMRIQEQARQELAASCRRVQKAREQSAALRYSVLEAFRANSEIARQCAATARQTAESITRLVSLLLLSSWSSPQRELLRALKASVDAAMTVRLQTVSSKGPMLEQPVFTVSPFRLAEITGGPFELIRLAAQAGAKADASISGGATTPLLGDATHIHQLLTLVTDSLLKLASLQSLGLDVCATPGAERIVELRARFSAKWTAESLDITSHLQRIAAASYTLQASRFAGEEACLAVAWQLAEAMGGVVSIEAAGQQDAQLTILLTLGVPPLAPPSETAPSRATPP